MAKTTTIQGIVKNVQTHLAVRGGGQQGHTNVRSYEIMTFDVVPGENPNQSVSVEIVGGSAFRNTGVIRSVPVSDGDEVRITGKMKEHGRFLRAEETDNLTTGVNTAGRRWSL
jgi:hypothetical protein